MIHFNVSLVEKDNKYTVHAVSQFEYFPNTSIYDIALEHQSATTKLFIDAVNITPRSIEIIDASVGSNDIHHSPSDENVSMKWGFSVTAENNTLNNTTQEWIRSAVMPLTRQYRTDILSQYIL